MLRADIKEKIETKPVELLVELLDTEIKHKNIRDFLEDVLGSSVGSDLLCATGGKNHHKKISGLLQHSLEVICLSLCACDLYERKGYSPINRELIVCVGLLHDIGKVSTSDDSLITHEVESLHVIYPFLDRSSLSDMFKKQLAHCIYTHMSNVREENTRAIRMIESFIIHSMDGISAYSDVYVDKVTVATPKGMGVTTNFKRELYVSAEE